MYPTEWIKFGYKYGNHDKYRYLDADTLQVIILVRDRYSGYRTHILYVDSKFLDIITAYPIWAHTTHIHKKNGNLKKDVKRNYIVVCFIPESKNRIPLTEILFDMQALEYKNGNPFDLRESNLIFNILNDEKN